MYGTHPPWNNHPLKQSPMYSHNIIFSIEIILTSLKKILGGGGGWGGRGFFYLRHLGNMTMQTPRIGIMHIFLGGRGGGGVRCFLSPHLGNMIMQTPRIGILHTCHFYTQLGKNKRAAVGMHHTLTRNIFNTKTN